MEIAYTVILIAGLVILAFFQNSRIKALERRVGSQKEILDLLKTYLEIFDAKQLQAWIQCRQRTLEQKNDAEIEKMCSWMAGLMRERFEAGHWKEREITAATDLMIRLLFYAPTSVRETSIAKMPNSMYKDAVKKLLDRIPECDQFVPPAGAGLA